MEQTPHRRILILDFGAQYTQLIARRVREQHVYCEIHPHTVDADFVREWDPAGIILSGGPSSVLDADSPTLDPDVLALDVPVLGICYGLQLMVKLLGGLVEKGTVLRGDGQDISFSVTDQVGSVTVAYSGILPDLFREEQGVVTEGTLRQDGVFVADSVLAKHDENYMPKEVAEGLKATGLWQDED